MVTCWALRLIGGVSLREIYREPDRRRRSPRGRQLPLSWDMPGLLRRPGWRQGLWDGAGGCCGRGPLQGPVSAPVRHPQLRLKAKGLGISDQAAVGQGGAWCVSVCGQGRGSSDTPCPGDHPPGVTSWVSRPQGVGDKGLQSHDARRGRRASILLSGKRNRTLAPGCVSADMGLGVCSVGMGSQSSGFLPSLPSQLRV